MIFPYIELDIKSFDLGIEHRDATNDKGKYNECIMNECTCTIYIQHMYVIMDEKISHLLNNNFVEFLSLKGRYSTILHKKQLTLVSRWSGSYSS